MSSPSRLVIDPLISSYGEADRKKSASSVLPPASKLLNSTTQQSQNMSGWTPLISRTFSNDMISYNSTPSSKMFPSFRPGSGTHNAIHSEYDYPGLNLTPFLTHNLNLLNNTNSAGNLSNNVNFTPFCDKSMHLTDFFMDSPIRQTPLKVESITPSKFNILPDAKPGAHETRLKAPLSLKRSITLIGTPARQPFKKHDGGDDDATSDSDPDEDGDPLATYRDNFVTPSKKKVLNEVSGNLLNKTPLKTSVLDRTKFQTPAKAHPVSSPSTVIMSSATKSPELVVQKNDKLLVPPSPTPNKDTLNRDTVEPIMGIFSESKTKLQPDKQAVANARKPSKKQQSGITRFQIVFTDVHTLMNNKKKKGGAANSSDKLDKKVEKKKSQNKLGAHQSPPLQYEAQMSHHQPHALSTFQHSSSSLSASQDFNTSMNSSREFSMLANNSTVNTTHTNLNSTEHSSFELMHGGPMSTPGKYVLDTLFDRNSPNTVRQGQAYPMHMQVKNTDTQRQEGVQAHHPHRDFMPPPPKTLTLQQAAHQALRSDQQLHHQPLMMNMVMSTPQHDNILHQHQHAFTEEMSPSNKEPMEYLYQHLQPYHQMNSPSNMQTINYAPHQTAPLLQAMDTKPRNSKKGATGRKSKRR